MRRHYVPLANRHLARLLCPSSPQLSTVLPLVNVCSITLCHWRAISVMLVTTRPMNFFAKMGESARNRPGFL